MTDKLTKIVQSIVNIPDDQLNRVIQVSRIKNLYKGEFFIQEGEIPNKFAFNLKGLFRYYYVNKKGNEFTKGFFPENTIISSYSAMIQNRASFFTIEALEDSTVAVIQFSDWKMLFKNHTCWKEFLIATLEKNYCIKESREREFLLLDAEDRYNSFLKSFPGLDKRVKQHLLASYLGITPVALSHLRNKMRVVNIA
jgi:CRP-like cAMP-binding protein